MKNDVKDGKNISIGDEITVINSGITLSEPKEEKKEDVAATEVAPIEVATDTEIKPDVVVGESAPAQEDNVIPIPIPVDNEPAPEKAEANPVDLPAVSPTIDIPSVIPTAPTAPEISITPEVSPISNDFNSDIAIFPQTTSSFNNNTNDFGQSDYNNVVYPSFSSGVPIEPEQNYPSFGNENTPAFNSFAGSYINDELSPGMKNAIKMLEDEAKEMSKENSSLKDENRAKDEQIESLKQANRRLENEVNQYKHQVANYESQIVSMQSRVLGMFGMSGMANGVPNNNNGSYTNFNDSQQNNNGINMAS